MPGNGRKLQTWPSLAKRVKTRPGELQQSQAGCKTRIPLGQALNMDS
ncbi:MAG: hypothetical protein QF562_02795 [Verrucomicrobiota bacterium]|nr:hypothetical protein [Verrucomicrobiota bacterium]